MNQLPRFLSAAARRMRVPVLCFGLTALVSGIILFSAVNLWSADDAAPGESRLKALQTEKVKTLEQLVMATTTGYQQGVGSQDDVIRARQALAEAQLDLCNTDAERIVVLKSMVEMAMKQEAAAEAGFRSGRISNAEVSSAKVARLTAEIALEKIAAR